MRPLHLIPALCILASCASDQRQSENKFTGMLFAMHTTSAHHFNVEYGVEGYYVGFFDALQYDEEKNFMYRNKITVAIDSLNEQTVFGHSIVAGNMRPFKGAYTKNGEAYTVIAREPGDDQYDGEFMFELHADKNTITGKWKSYNKTLAVTEREYMLEKKEFAYNAEYDLPDYLPEEGLFGTYEEASDKSEALTADVYKINPSKVLLKKEDVENMYQADLEVMRNSIYARHGYSFRNRKMRYLFDNMVEWYMPVSIDITSELTEIERKNIDLIKRYELHAEKYYDVFGR